MARCPKGHALTPLHGASITSGAYCDTCYCPVDQHKKRSDWCTECGWVLCWCCKATPPRLSKEEANLRQFIMEILQAMKQEQRDEVYKEWRRLDDDCSGHVSLQELVDWVSRGGAQRCNLALDPSGQLSRVAKCKQLFNLIDVDKSGRLDFWEAGMLLLLGQGNVNLWCCDTCEKLLFSDCMYTCPSCWVEALCPDSTEGGPKCDAGSVPTYCMECMDKGRNRHQHDLQLVRNDMLQHVPREDSCVTALKTTCSVCHDQHSMGVPSYLGGGGGPPHMRKYGNDWVCEWCYMWVCCSCGGAHNSIAEQCGPGAWSKRTQCTPCARKGLQGNWTFNADTYTARARDTGRLHCDQCRQRILSGSILNGGIHTSTVFVSRVTQYGSHNLQAAYVSEAWGTGLAYGGSGKPSALDTIGELAGAFNNGYEIGTAASNLAATAVNVAATCTIM